MKRILTITFGVVGIFVGVGFICPAIAQLRSNGSLPGAGVALLLLGILLAVGGGTAAFRGFRQRSV
ncbi:MAG TPA: hypothetical protein VI454_09120 [Verrucomicrobiae bacterium]|jgi:hypothetical protein